MGRTSSFVVLLTATSLGVWGCGGSTNRPDGPGSAAKYAPNATFTYAINDDLGVFDPYRTSLAWPYSKLAYDSLVNLQPDGTFVSGLAQRWTVDAKTATFTLRHGITCSDGTPLTASQVVADLNFVKAPKSQSPLYGFSVPKTPFTATADDAAGTVKISMKKEPFGFLLNSIGDLPIMCANALREPKILKTGSAGTGPYVLASVVPGQSYTFTVRNGYNWGPGGAGTSAPGTPAKLVLKVVTNESTRANLLLSGTVNLARIAGTERQRLSAHRLDKFELNEAGSWMDLNQLGGRPTADKRVRQALVQALDLDQLVKVSTGGTGHAATGLVAKTPKPCVGNTVAGQLPKHDARAAASLLDQAGWVKGPNGFRGKDGKPLALDVHYLPSNSDFEKPTAEFIGQQWTALGVKVRLTGDTNTGAVKVLYQTSGWDVYLVPFGFSLPSQLVSYLSGPVPPNGTNFAGLDNKEYNTLVAKASAMTPPAACTYWNQAEQALLREVDVVPLATTSISYFLNQAQAQATGRSIPLPTTIRVLR